MKKMLLYGLFVLLIMCIAPVGAYEAYDDFVEGVDCDLYLHRVDIMENDENDITDLSSIQLEITQYPLHGIIYGPDYDPDRGTGWLVYDHDRGFKGSDSLKYRVYDSATNTYSNEAYVFFFTDSYLGKSHDWIYTIPKDTLLSNGIFSDCWPFLPSDSGNEFHVGSSVSHGILTLHTINSENDGSFDYLPNSGFSGIDQFTVTEWYDSGDFGYCLGIPYSVIINVQNPNPSPEFPSTLLPVTMIIGFLGAVFYIKRTKEH